MAPHSDGREKRELITLGELARLAGGVLEGDADGQILGIARLEDATAAEVSFCALREYRTHLSGTGAAAVIVAKDFEPPRDVRENLAFIRVENPYLAVAQVLNHFFPEDECPSSIHPSAVIDDSAEIGEDVSVGAARLLGKTVKLAIGLALELAVFLLLGSVWVVIVMCCPM